MATGNKLEITLSFKPLMDGLNRFTAGINQRLEQVKAFNERIRNGDAALQKMIGQVGTVLGAAALARFAQQAREADKVQAQLIRTLQRTGETGALQALNDQAAALQRVTSFGDESINTVQRLLISFGLGAQQAIGLTEAVLDFAQETGQSAESAAMLIGRTLAGESDELGRYKIQLDTTKGKVDALREALVRFAAGAARGGVANRAERDAQARFDDATENLGRAANEVAVPFLSALVPLLERIAVAAASLAHSIAPIAPMLGDMAAAVLPGIVALGLLSGGITAVRMVINPLRAAFVLFAGRTLLEMNNGLAALTTRFGMARVGAVLLKDAFTSVAGAGRALAVAGAVTSAAFIGWNLGELANEIEVSGMKVKDWAAIFIVAIQDKIGGAFAWLRIAWTNTSSFLQQGMVAFLAVIRETQLAAQEKLNDMLRAWNNVAQRFGLNQATLYDTSALRAQVDSLNKKLGDLEEQRRAAVAAIEAERAAQLAGNAELAEYIRQTSQLRPAGGEGAGPTDSRPDPNSQTFGTGKDDADRIRRLETEDLFALETEMIQAEAAGDSERATRIKEYLRFKALELQMEGSSGALLMERIAAENELERVQRVRQEQEQQYSREIAALEFDLQLIEQDRFLLQEEKDRLRIAKLDEINAKIAARIALLEREQKLNPDAERQGQIDELRGRQRDNQAQGESLKPLSIWGGLEAAAVAMQSRIGTIAQQISGAFTSVGDSIRTSLGGALADMVLRATSFKDAVIGFSSAVATAFVNAGAQMVADWIMSHLIMENVRRIFGLKRVTEEATTQAALTGIEATGATARTGIAAGAAATNTAIATTEAGAIATAAGIAGVFRSIMELGPIAGPLVFGTAIAGMVALVASLAKGFATGGIVEGPGTGTSDSILARLSNGEGVIRARSVGLFGRDFIEGINAGILDLGALPSHIAAGLTLPDYALADGGRMRLQGRSGGGAEPASSPTFVFVDSPASAARAQRKYTDARFIELSRKHQGRRIR